MVGAMIWDEESKNIKMQTIGSKVDQFILAELDMNAGTCKTIHQLDQQLVPLFGLMSFDKSKKDKTLTFLRSTARPDSMQDTVEALSKVEILPGTNIVISPMLTRASKTHLMQNLVRVDALKENGEVKYANFESIMGPPRPVPPQPQTIINYNLVNGLITDESPVTCEPIKGRDCPWQLHWYT